MTCQISLFCTVVVIGVYFTTSAYASAGCFSTFQALNAVEAARSTNNTLPLTRVICSNSLFVIEGWDRWSLNGNTNYLCGTNGSSKNNCTVRGGNYQLEIAEYAFDFSNKSNILLSGFTFEKADILSAHIASAGKFTIRDCIFKNHNNHGVFQALYSGGPPELDIINRRLSRNFMMHRVNHHRQLLIGGGSEPRSTIHFDGCQFLNNSLTSNITFPSFASNGPLDIVSHFADVTVTNCLFKENHYEYSFDSGQEAFLITIRPSATLNISNSCLINNYISGMAPIDISADSGLAATRNNFVTDVPIDDTWNEPISPCQYMVLREAYKCVAPESSVCRLPACEASYEYYNARSDRFVANIINGGNITASPCGFNIKVNLPCLTTGKNVTLQLLHPNNTIVTARHEKRPPFFLFGNGKRDILAGSVNRGTYKIQVLVGGVIQPSPRTFTLSGQCTTR